MFDSPLQIVYLRSKGLEIYDKKTRGFLEKQDFLPSEFANGKVVNKDDFRQSLADFLGNILGKSQKVAVVVSDELTYSKVVDLTTVSAQQLDEIKKRFFDEVPVGKNDFCGVGFTHKKQFFLVACSKKLLEIVASVFSQIGKELEFIVPADAFGISSGASLALEDVHLITSNPELVKLSNFPYAKVSKLPEAATLEEEAITKQPEVENSSFDAKYFLVPAAAIIIVSLVVSGYLFFNSGGDVKFSVGGLKLPFLAREASNVKPSPSPTTAEQVQKISDLSKLSVEVVNGTGVPGQAGKVQTDLESLGFVDVTTANSSDTTNTATKVEYSAEVDQSVRTKVESELSKTFDKVEGSDMPSASAYQIIITTGTEASP